MTAQKTEDTLNPPGAPDAGAEAARVLAQVARAARVTPLLHRPGPGFAGAPLAQLGQPGPAAQGGEGARPEAADATSTAEPAGEGAEPARTPRPPLGEPDLSTPGSSLEAWFATPQGAYILDWELARIDQAVADVFGYYAVQVGLPGIDFLRASRISSRLTAGLRGTPAVVADAHELPFATESLDLVVLPHLLEFSTEPHQILREVERVLRPEGQVVILCFNPVSLWGVRKLFTPSTQVPWSGEFVSVLRMKDWLKLLNFEMRGGRFGRYRLPYSSEKWLSRFGFLEQAGDRWWPVAGAVYLMQAVKRVPGMRIITPSWRKARKAEALAASPNGINRGAGRGADLNLSGTSGQLRAVSIGARHVHSPYQTPYQKKVPE